MAKKKAVKTTYKVWTTIEKHIEYSDGSEKYVNLKQEIPRTLGTFSTLEKVNEQISILGDVHQNDSDDTLL